MSGLNKSVGKQGTNLREDVMIVQGLLRDKGFNPGPVDGFCGAKTIAAISEFQSTFLSKPDGLIEPGRNTWKRLALVSNAPPVSPVATTSVQTSLLGSVGAQGKNNKDDVLLVQGLLKSKGFKPGGVDGFCGANTIAAIIRFQATFLSNPDGLIEPGKSSWRHLANANPVGVPATPAQNQWTGDSARWSQEKKLQSMEPTFRIKVEATIKALKARGFQPKIFYGWRSVAVQLELYKKKRSKVTFSFHNAQQPNGTPSSYAADIIDKRYAWNAEATSSGFWDALGEEGKKQGLYWGGDWKSFRDWAHVQLVDNNKLSQVKRESGL